MAHVPLGSVARSSGRSHFSAPDREVLDPQTTMFETATNCGKVVGTVARMFVHQLGRNRGNRTRVVTVAQMRLKPLVQNAQIGFVSSC